MRRIKERIQSQWTELSAEIEISPEPSQPDWPIIAVLFLLPTALTSRYYFELSANPFSGYLAYPFEILGISTGWVELLTDGLFPMANLLLLPVLVLLLLNVTLPDMGFTLPAIRSYRLLSYLLLVIHGIILVLATAPLFSTGGHNNWITDAFSQGATFWATQFLSRGALAALLFGISLFPLYQRFGSQALTIVLVPFCMVHFTGPLSLVILSIPVGLGLGYLAINSRSVTCTVLIYSLLSTLLNAMNLYL